MHWSFLGHMTDPNNPFAAFNWYNGIGALGCLLWMIAYYLFIRQGFRDKTYGVPMAAICLNITWEAYTPFLPNPVPLWKYIEITWFLIDAVIVWQLWTYGKATMLPKTLQVYHRPVVAAMLGLALGFHITWHSFWDDHLLFIDAYLINLIMSVLFVSFYFNRPNQEGLTITGAWLKMIGSLFTGIQSLVFLPKVMTAHQDWTFLWFLVGAIALADGVYIWLLYHGRRVARQLANG